MQAPSSSLIGELSLMLPEELQLSNEIPLTVINAGSQELCRIEFIFKAGIIHQQKALVASFTNELIDEGTSTSTASALSEKLDHFGAFVETEIQYDHASVVVYSLNKHLAGVLEIVEEFLKDAIYPAKELEIFASNQKQKFEVSNEKVNTVCRRKFPMLLFGNTHAYGADISTDDFLEVKQKDLLAFHSSFYHGGNCAVMISGKVGDRERQLIEKHFGGNDWKKQLKSEWDTGVFEPTMSRKHMIGRENAMQSALRIGRVLFNRLHPDYHEMQVLNTILGGYFGSRLMSNIREDKGYTYGIGSGCISLRHSGYFFISTEVGVDVCAPAINEVYKEIAVLREVPVGIKELQTVRQYMLGTCLSGIDGPFMIADRIKTLKLFGLQNDHFGAYVNTINTITPARIRDLANQYLQEEHLTELVVGKKG